MARCDALIIGSGPAGLSCALSLLKHGIRPRIIERRPNRANIQKATGVAQGVWHQLAEFGITQKLIGDAFPMRQFVFHDNDRLVAQLQVPPVNGSAPAHLFPQHRLELALEQALIDQGVHVDYCCRFESLESKADKAFVTVRNQEAETEVIETDWVIAADGGHSDVRIFLDMPFLGHDYPEQWSVAEIKTELWPAEVQAQLFLQSDGVGLFLSQPSQGTVQGILNARDVSARLKSRFPDAAIDYEREFKVSLRRVETCRSERVWFIGDAAHVQSPVGGQGLNLAIWDGVTLGAALARNDLSVEYRLNKRAKAVLRFTDFDYWMLCTRSLVIRHARNLYWSLAQRFPIMAGWFFRLISGVW